MFDGIFHNFTADSIKLYDNMILIPQQHKVLIPHYRYDIYISTL